MKSLRLKSLRRELADREVFLAASVGGCSFRPQISYAFAPKPAYSLRN